MNAQWVVAEGFGAVADLFARSLADDPAHSAQVCAYVGDSVVFEAWGGPELARDSLVCVYSSTKGVVGVCVAMLVERGLLDLDERVAHYWPEFAAMGKDRVLVRELLSHQAGLSEADGGLTWREFADDVAGAARLAAQRPFWRPGSAWSYHALTLGVLVNELFRRILGENVQTFFEREVRAPRGIDFYLGLPPELSARVAPAVFPEPPPTHFRPRQLYDLVVEPLAGEPGFAFLGNASESHAAGIPAGGGVGSAVGLAQVYAAVGTGVKGHPRLLLEETIDAFGQIQSSGNDLISGQPGRFGVVFMKPWTDRPFAGHRAIGHDGAAGALGFYDPENRLAFGYATNRPAPIGRERRADDLAIAIAEAIG